MWIEPKEQPSQSSDCSGKQKTPTLLDISPKRLNPAKKATNLLKSSTRTTCPNNNNKP
jgi:hypothetical protein